MHYSVIIPNLNGRHLLEVCLPALVPQVDDPSSVIVVDNGSSDGSVEWLAGSWPRVSVVPLGGNTGFTGANNAGAASCDSPVLVLLNNDTRPSGDWLERLLEPLGEPGTGAVSSSMRRMGEPSVMDSAGGALDTLGYTYDRGRGEPADRWALPDEILFPCGGAMALRREALEDPSVIFWDTLFCYNEDTDLGLRLWKTGYRCVYNPGAVVEHAMSATAGTGSPVRMRYCARNRILVMRRHLGECFRLVSRTLALWETLALAYMLAMGEFARFRASLRGCREGFGEKIEPWGDPGKALTLYARFMEPTAGTKVRRRLGEAVYQRISGSAS